MKPKKGQQLSLLWALAKTDFKLRYHGSILGYVWALLKPLLIFLILNFVFSNIFGAGVENYSLQLLTGIILWNYFAEGTMVGLTSLLNKAGIITKIAFPQWIVVIASILNVTMTFIISLIILSIFFLVYGVIPGPIHIVLFLLCCLLTFMMIIIFSLLASPQFLKFRDLNQIWEVLLTAGFYAAPIIYPITAIPEKMRFVVYINPMTPVVEWSKTLLVKNAMPDIKILLTVTIITTVLLALSIIIFKHSSRRVAENV